MKFEWRHAQHVPFWAASARNDKEKMSRTREQSPLADGGHFKNPFEKIILCCRDFRKEARARGTGRRFGTVGHGQQP